MSEQYRTPAQTGEQIDHILQTMASGNDFEVDLVPDYQILHDGGTRTPRCAKAYGVSR
jgi:hypothetical protein